MRCKCKHHWLSQHNLLCLCPPTPTVLAMHLTLYMGSHTVCVTTSLEQLHIPPADWHTTHSDICIIAITWKKPSYSKIFSLGTTVTATMFCQKYMVLCRLSKHNETLHIHVYNIATSATDSQIWVGQNHAVLHSCHIGTPTCPSAGQGKYEC